MFVMHEFLWTLWVTLFTTLGLICTQLSNFNFEIHRDYDSVAKLLPTLWKVILRNESFAYAVCFLENISSGRTQSNGKKELKKKLLMRANECKQRSTCPPILFLFLSDSCRGYRGMAAMKWQVFFPSLADHRPIRGKSRKVNGKQRGKIQGIGTCLVTD